MQKVILLIISILILLICIYKLKYPFWHKQPVFHYHNLWYWLVPPGIIQHEKPPKDKFYDHKIIFKSFFSMPLEKKVAFTTFIKRHYMPHKHEKYKPSQEAILGYFKNHNDKSYLSLKYENSKLISTMSTRPLKCYIENNEMDLYYVDFLCVHKKYRKKGNAPKIIYTHYVNQRECHKNTVFLFKREGEKTLIVPLTIYNNYMFDTLRWDKKVKFDDPDIQCLKIHKENFQQFIYVYERLLQNKKFICLIMPNLNHILSLLKSEKIFIFVTLLENEPYDCIIFNNSYTSYDGDDSIECICSYKETHESVFVLSFMCALSEINKIKSFRYIFLENISDNGEILKKIMKRYAYKEKITTSYYFYNFGYRPFESKNVFMLN